MPYIHLYECNYLQPQSTVHCQLVSSTIALKVTCLLQSLTVSQKGHVLCWFLSDELESFLHLLTQLILALIQYPTTDVYLLKLRKDLNSFFLCVHSNPLHKATTPPSTASVSHVYTKTLSTLEEKL